LELNYTSDIKAEGLTSFLTPKDFPAAPKKYTIPAILLIPYISKEHCRACFSKHKNIELILLSRDNPNPFSLLFNVYHKISSNNILSFINMT